jgi:hypothetical protein
MTQFTMRAIRTQEGVRRDIEDWDDGLVNFGYEECEGITPVQLVAQDMDQAKQEAARRWEQMAPQGFVDQMPEGYWIVGADDQIEHIEIKDYR